MREPLLVNKPDEYQAVPGDPAYRPHKPKKLIRLEKNKIANRGKSKKVLTNQNRWSIIKRVSKKVNRKEHIVKDITTNKKSNKKRFDYRGAIKSIAWLVEAAVRAFTGWTLLANFDNYITTAAAIYLLGTAGVIVIRHFVKAHIK